MDGFFQDPPRHSNRFVTDRVLRRTCERLLEPEVLEEAAGPLTEMGDLAAGPLLEMSDRAEGNPPRLVHYDPWGQRVDRLDVDPSWTKLVEIGQQAGVVSMAYERRWGDASRIVQAALLHMYQPVTATADCPLAMTDAAARVLLNEDKELADKYVPRLTARQEAITSGQWMTEKQGGSDVSRTGTVARGLEGDRFTLHGTKWFTSATTADIALALARHEDDEAAGLSLFLVELRNETGGWNNITVRRLKDKMGTKALPTAELELDGTIATVVGGRGRGVAKVAPMLNITRLHSAIGSSSGIGHGLMLARDYAARREAFGRRLSDLPVHTRWMATIASVYEATVALCFRAAELLGRAEGSGSDAELARVVLPLTKMAVARQGVWGTSQLIESFGGAGYVEDTGLPRLLRDAHVQCIWEGTTSVMALDVLRALSKPGVAQAFLEDVEAKARAYDHPAVSATVTKVLSAHDRLSKMILEADEASARHLAWGMARTYQAACLCEAAGWELDKHSDARTATAASIFASRPLIDEEPPATSEELAALAFC